MSQFASGISILGDFVVAEDFGGLDEIGKMRIMEEISRNLRNLLDFTRLVELS